MRQNNKKTRNNSRKQDNTRSQDTAMTRNKAVTQKKFRSTNSFSVFVRFLRIMGRPLPLFLFAMIIHMVGDNLFNVTLSLFVKNVVEMAQQHEISGLSKTIIWSIVAGVVSLLVFFLFGVIYDIEAKKGNAKVQKLVVEKALRMPMEYYESHHKGELLSKLLNDADAASQIFTSRLRRVTTPAMSVLVYFIPMVLMNARLAVGLLIVNIITLVVNSQFVGPMKQLGKQTSDNKKRMTKDITTIVAGINMIKLYTGCRILIQQFIENVASYSKTRRRTVKMSAVLGGFHTFFDLVCSLGFLLLSIWCVDTGKVSIGSVAAIYTLYGSFSYNFLELGKYIPELMNCIARAEIIFDFLDGKEAAGIAQPLQASAENAENQNLAVELQNINFAYPNEPAQTIIKNLNLKIPVGSSIAIIGQSGCGKSTLCKLLLGFYPIDQGSMKIMGVDAGRENLSNLRDSIDYVPQKSHLFALSIKENIRLGNQNATDREIEEAAQLANADSFIRQLPEGYDTLVVNGGNNLSLGEQQRIALARAFVKKAPILLLDEATSSLDNENDNLIQKTIKQYSQNHTAIIIAHKPATITACSRQFVMN